MLKENISTCISSLLFPFSFFLSFLSLSLHFSFIISLAFVNYSDLISQLLMERLVLFHQTTPTHDHAPSRRKEMVTYLLECYNRTVIEERHIKVTVTVQYSLSLSLSLSPSFSKLLLHCSFVPLCHCTSVPLYHGVCVCVLLVPVFTLG